PAPTHRLRPDHLHDRRRRRSRRCAGDPPARPGPRRPPPRHPSRGRRPRIDHRGGGMTLSTREPSSTDAAPAAAGPYSQAIRAGELVFTAGQLGLDPASGEFAGTDVATQAERAIANLEAILLAAGSGLDRLVKVTVFLAEIADWPAV